MPVPDLPLEVITYIINFISSPADLLSATLTNRTIASFSLPGLNYCFIRSGLSNNALWTHLVTHPDLAAHVRELEIMREDTGRWKRFERDRFPKDISTWSQAGYDVSRSLEDVERSEKLLIAALHVLVNIEKFTWKHSAPVVIQGNNIPSDLLEEGGAFGIETYTEDVWTALRDHTSLRELKLFDKGFWVHPGAKLRSIYSLYKSQMGSIRNLTRVELRILTKYSTQSDESDVADVPEQLDVNSDNDNIGDVSVLPTGPVKISVLCTFLRQCSNLEHLTLAYYPDKNSSGTLSTNLTHLFTSTYWPRLSSLHLTDIVVNKPVITQFLIIHSHIRSLSASLSLKHPDDMPELPFTIDPVILKERGLIGAFLPELEEVDLPAELVREVLRVVKNLGRLKVVKTLERCDWVEPDGDMKNLLHSRYDRKQRNHRKRKERERDKAAADVGVDVNMKLLKKMTGVRTLAVTDLWHLHAELELLADLTPQLEALKVVGEESNTQICPLYVEPVRARLLSYICKWRHLTSFTGLPLWGVIPHLGFNPQSHELRELAEACPVLREVTWKTGEEGFLVKDETGKEITMDRPYPQNEDEIQW